MATIDYGAGEREIVCSAWTAVLYEQEFHSDPNERITGDIIADVMWKYTVTSDDAVRVTDDGKFEATIDFTRENRAATYRALWAMLKTAAEVARDEGRPCEDVPSYRAWTKTLLKCEPDMSEVSRDIAQELQRGLFRAGAAASRKTSEEES